MGTRQFPTELILQVLENVEHDVLIRLDEASSPYYWCIPPMVLRTVWSERRRQKRVAWSESVPPLCQINRGFREVMTGRLQVFNTLPTWEAFGPSNSSQTKRAVLSANVFRNHTSLFIFGEDLIPYRTWLFINVKSDVWESITLDMDFEHPNMTGGLFELYLTNLPNLTSFTFRATGVKNWVDHMDIRRLVKASPKLKHLTISHLWGASTDSTSDPNPTCCLHSLYLRRFRHCNKNTLDYFVLNSLQSLQEVTIVLDGAIWWRGLSHRFYRGIYATDIQAVFASCVELRTLRFAEIVPRLGYNRPFIEHVDPELDPEFGPLGYILDDMVEKLRQLEILRICGRTFSMRLFDNLRNSGCRLKELSVQNYPGFPIPRFLQQLKENPALSRLEKFQIGTDAISDQYEGVLALACQELKIEFQTIDYENVFKYPTWEGPYEIL
ncbi:hypothetical protein O181_032713 [Austropuccinia psidii MF-1]|uniref:F-box domain-containing protein n=1 Tax=Austropuccinia psidii MF-1 TaxID=1389203 RepID=A0A9Q3H5R5_9BASI|nr:hypothetical protein [Austropuccinia psidii MF-1]